MNHRVVSGAMSDFHAGISRACCVAHAVLPTAILSNDPDSRSHILMG